MDIGKQEVRINELWHNEIKRQRNCLGLKQLSFESSYRLRVGTVEARAGE